MADHTSVRGVKRRALLVSALAASAFLVAASAASADTQFGGDPTQAPTAGLTCESGAAPFHGAASCLWDWSGTTGTDNVPFPETTGGSGTVTSVTLPAMPNPGPMQAVVLTGTLISSSSPTQPDYYCCKVIEISPTFTVPANQVTTVPLNLAVSSQPTPNFSIPGTTGSFDGMAISVLSPTASLPLLYTGKTLIGSGADRNQAYFPAPSQTNSEYSEPTDPTGYELLARFNLGATPAPAPAPAPTPAPAAGGGLKLNKGGDVVGADGKTVGLGTATNPPTATTVQTLTLPTAGAARAGKSKKPVVLGQGKTTIPSGKKAALTLTLNGKARGILKKRGKLTGTLTIVATNSQGESQTVTKAVTVKPPKKSRRSAARARRALLQVARQPHGHLSVGQLTGDVGGDHRQVRLQLFLRCQLAEARDHRFRQRQPKADRRTGPDFLRTARRESDDQPFVWPAAGRP